MFQICFEFAIVLSLFYFFGFENYQNGFVGFDNFYQYTFVDHIEVHSGFVEGFDCKVRKIVGDVVSNCICC